MANGASCSDSMANGTSYSDSRAPRSHLWPRVRSMVARHRQEPRVSATVKRHRQQPRAAPRLSDTHNSRASAPRSHVSTEKPATSSRIHMRAVTRGRQLVCSSLLIAACQTYIAHPKLGKIPHDHARSSRHRMCSECPPSVGPGRTRGRAVAERSEEYSRSEDGRNEESYGGSRR